jgi:hypothetical protein
MRNLSLLETSMLKSDRVTLRDLNAYRDVLGRGDIETRISLYGSKYGLSDP